MKNKHHTYDSKVLTITVKSPGSVVQFIFLSSKARYEGKRMKVTSFSSPGLRLILPKPRSTESQVTTELYSSRTGSYTWLERISEFLKEKGILK